MSATPATTSTGSTFGAIFSEILSKGLDTAGAYANASLAIKSAEAQAKANRGATATTVVAAPGTPNGPSATPPWLPWVIGAGVAVLGLLGLGMIFRR